MTQKREPTPREKELLSAIVNERQWRALMKAIEEGHEIPDYAWTPVPNLPDKAQKRLDEGIQRIIRRGLERRLGKDAMDQLDKVDGDAEI